MMAGTSPAITGVFQGLLLFYLLAADLFIHYRFKPRRRAGTQASPSIDANPAQETAPS